jgi:Outer membrane lipoprotein-sorting protein
MQLPTVRPTRPRPFAALALAVISLPMLLSMSGCASWFISKRKLPIPVAPPSVQTATADELAARINNQWATFQSLTATVDILASHLKAKEGVATDYPTFHANLLLRKPEMIRVLGHLPVLQTKMFDLASDGTRFTLVIFPKSIYFQDLNARKGNSPNWYENLRPGPLFDAMVVRGLDKEDLYSVITQVVTLEDTAHKRLLAEPEYVLNIQRQKPNSQELYPVRVIHIHREDLMPYEQDLYDDKGTLETQVIYGPYKDFDGAQYPSTITLKRPEEEYQLIMTVQSLNANPPLTDDQFHEEIPEGYKKQELK